MIVMSRFPHTTSASNTTDSHAEYRTPVRGGSLAVAAAVAGLPAMALFLASVPMLAPLVLVVVLLA